MMVWTAPLPVLHDRLAGGGQCTGRVHQRRIFAHQAALAPVHFDQEIQGGDLDRLLVVTRITGRPRRSRHGEAEVGDQAFGWRQTDA